MNYLEGVQRLHRESGRSTTAPTGLVGATDRNQRLFDWYADAWRDIQTERDWRFMRATLNVALTVNQQTYTGSGLGATRFGRWRAEDGDYQVNTYSSGSPNGLLPLKFWQLDRFKEFWVYRDMGASQPTAWTVDENDQLLIGPKPSEAFMLRIDYWKSPQELTADEDEPDLPDRFKLLPMWRALKAVALNDAAPETLTRAEREYDILHNRMLSDQARRPTLW